MSELLDALKPLVAAAAAHAVALRAAAHTADDRGAALIEAEAARWDSMAAAGAAAIANRKQGD